MCVCDFCMFWDLILFGGSRLVFRSVQGNIQKIVKIKNIGIFLEGGGFCV